MKQVSFHLSATSSPPHNSPVIHDVVAFQPQQKTARIWNFKSDIQPLHEFRVWGQLCPLIF